MTENKAYCCNLRTQPRRELQNGVTQINSDKSLCGIWSNYRIQLQYDSIQYYQNKTWVGYKLQFIPHQVFEHFVDSSQSLVQATKSAVASLISYMVKNKMVQYYLNISILQNDLSDVEDESKQSLTDIVHKDCLQCQLTSTDIST
ncbi:Hypothetical_protein [Hexamita inflata]|uniref:Hypothetical_protein n=1 Tax=Hexamita inflata TaxID=28002 RepID=A0AA86Q740_9EUKA|nr:Hypothetical protein HINF_LOCUS39536 [Hexamita inflata]